MDESLSLWALFASSFLAATLLPGGSEAVLFGVLKINPQTKKVLSEYSFGDVENARSLAQQILAGG